MNLRRDPAEALSKALSKRCGLNALSETATGSW
jgi:hypothetical protein